MCIRDSFIATDTITAAAQTLIEVQELDYDVSHVTTRRIGRSLKKMRLQQVRVGKSSKRGWYVSLEEVIRWAGSYGLDPREITGIEPPTHPTNGEMCIRDRGRVAPAAARRVRGRSLRAGRAGHGTAATAAAKLRPVSRRSGR